MKQMINHVNNGILYINRAGTVEEINERACVLIGIEKDQAMGKHIFELFDKTGLVRVMEDNQIEEDVE